MLSEYVEFLDKLRLGTFTTLSDQIQVWKKKTYKFQM